MVHIILFSLILTSGTFLLLMAIFALRHKRIKSVKIFSILMIAMTIHCYGYAFELLSQSVSRMYFWVRIEYIGISFYPFLIMFFAREYVDDKKIASKPMLGVMFASGVMTFILVQTNQYHYLYYSSLEVSNPYGFKVLSIEKGFGYFVQGLTLYVSLLYSLTVYINRIRSTKGSVRKRAIVMLVGAMIPIVTVGFYVLELLPQNIDTSPFSYMFMSLVMMRGLYRYSLIFLGGVTHEMVLNAIEEAVFVVDRDGYIININTTSKGYFEPLCKITYGEELSKYPLLQSLAQGERIQTFEVAERHYQLKIIPFGKDYGDIFIFSDVTETVQAKNKLEVLATTDSLTSLFNRRHFIDAFGEVRNDGVLMLLDIDHFKIINDQHGHIEGDRVLSQLGAMLKQHFSKAVHCRYGGEEFAALFEGMKIDEVYLQAESFRCKIAERKEIIKYTVSMGIVPIIINDFQQTIIHADRCLYQAKENGRNQICLLEDVK